MVDDWENFVAFFKPLIRYDVLGFKGVAPNQNTKFSSLVY